MKKELNRLYCGECKDVMQKKIPDVSIDLTIAGPPYDNLRKYNGFEFDFEGIANELFRVTKEGGVVVWIVGDATIKGDETGTSFRQALYFKEIGFNLHDTMIWYKPNPVPTQSNRYETSFEYMFVLSKGTPKTTNILRVPSKTKGKTRSKHRASNGEAHLDNDEGTYTTSSTRIEHNVWSIGVANGSNKKHPAIFPEKLVRDHIESWSNEGDIVLDLFSGSGTTSKMAKLTDRIFIGIEISEEYCEIANQRIAEVGFSMVEHIEQFKPESHQILF